MMLFTANLSFGQVVYLYYAMLLLVVYALLLAIHRLYFSKIAAFPGPWIAAVSWWPQFYHDVVCRGQYIWVVQEMHRQYGPIVRINPDELHICDSDFYHTLYVSGGLARKRDKWSWDTVGAGGVQDSALSTVHHSLHRVRRSAIAQFFSMQNVHKLQPVIQSKADLLVRRLLEDRDRAVETNIQHAFSALTNDIIMEYCFAQSYNRLEASDFDPSYKHASHRGVRLAQIAKHIRFLQWIAKGMLALPEAVLAKCGSTFEMFLVERKRLHRQISDVQQHESRDVGADAAHLTVFREILNSKLPPEEKTPARLAAEAQVLVSAGSETTARALTVALFKLLTHPKQLAALKSELEAAMPNVQHAEHVQAAQTQTQTQTQTQGSAVTSSPPLERLQQLPYLTGVIKESLRLSYGVVGRLQRIWPSEDMVYGGRWTVPAGTPVSMTSYDLHHDEAIFPGSHQFRPERWIGADPGLDRYLVSFGKGSRHCVGMNLAMAELYVTLATLFRSFGSEAVRRQRDLGQLVLFESDESDIKMVGEVLVPFVKKDARGVRVMIRP